MEDRMTKDEIAQAMYGDAVNKMQRELEARRFGLPWPPHDEKPSRPLGDGFLLRNKINGIIDTFPQYIAVPAHVIHGSLRWSAYASVIVAALTTGQPASLRDAFLFAATHATASWNKVTDIETPVRDTAYGVSMSAAHKLFDESHPNVVRGVEVMDRTIGVAEMVLVSGPARAGAAVGGYFGAFIGEATLTLFNKAVEKMKESSQKQASQNT
jgi:hypothetical protein